MRNQNHSNWLTMLTVQNGPGSLSPNLQTLGADALAAVTGHVNFEPYGNNGNGYVDVFIMIHAGMGGEVTGNVDNIWSAK
jgi:immune inhibitor A